MLASLYGSACASDVLGVYGTVPVFGSDLSMSVRVEILVSLFPLEIVKSVRGRYRSRQPLQRKRRW